MRFIEEFSLGLNVLTAGLPTRNFDSVYQKAAVSCWRVLVVDDEPLFQIALSRRLRRFCEPTTVDTLAAARDAIASGAWSAFLVDVQLPDGRGTSLLPHVRERHRTEPIFVMTGADPLTASHEAASYRALFVMKPPPVETLEAMLAEPRLSCTCADLHERLRSLGLSPRECFVFGELATGATAEVVADRLDISAATVRSHTRHVYARLRVNSLMEVISRANGWSR